MIFGTLSLLLTITVGAADEEDEMSTEAGIAKYYLQTNKFNTPNEKLDTMNMMLKNNKYELYVDPVSGEVALYEPATDNYLFSNPYDVASSKGADMFSSGSASTKEQLLMSQVIIQFNDNGAQKTLYSFVDAAMRGQINVSKIKNGVRVEYTIGREEFRKLVPRWIPADNFEELLLKPLREAIEAGDTRLGGIPDTDLNGDKVIDVLDNFDYMTFRSFYQLKDPEKVDTQAALNTMYNTYPITKEMPIYVFDTTATQVELNKVESYIKDFCADTYTFEQMDADHETTGYEAENEEYPVFKLALEYSLDDSGLSVRMPCNGLQYNTASYTLENLSILPYMGAGNTKNDGYNFYPDGSGSLFDFNLNKQTTLRSKIYGIDFAYHQVSGAYQKAVRVPVYGTVATETIYTYGYRFEGFDDAGVPVKEEVLSTSVSSTVKSREEIEALLSRKGTEIIQPLTEKTYKRGYVAIIESGESLGEIETYYAGVLSDYATMSNYFNPKPKDSYDISDSISVTASSTWTVVSNRKYTGNIKIHYQMLCDEAIGEAQKQNDSTYKYYDASWLGMADAYRDYLIGKGQLQALTEEEVESDIPLYMEVFGALETQQIIATLPVDVMTPLTTFENILTMYGELSEVGVKNINFKLTGFANGGMYSTIPSSLKWESAVGGKSGFKKLVAEANNINASGDKNIGLYPDFNFAYAGENTLFDALNLKDDAARTIDNRYTSLREYSATQQKYISFYQLAISPSRYNKFYEKIMKNYEQYGINTMSVASLGTALNSDFDEDDPYNREDSKEFTIKALADMQQGNKYSLMTDGGNAYTWAYVDHIINLDLDSSRYVKASASVPFIGAVLHGYVQFAGSPLNEEGDAEYAMLKAIENGAGLYFILSYQNTQELKEDELLSQYYSIRYDIWKDDVVSYYNTLNSLLKDVQTKKIISHKFLNYEEDGVMYYTERVLDADELEKEIEEELKRAEEEAKEQEKNEIINQIASIAEARITLQKSLTLIDEALANTTTIYNSMTNTYSNLLKRVEQISDKATNQTLAQKDIDGFRNVAVSLWQGYNKSEYQYTLADEVLKELKDCLDLIEDAKVGTSAEYQYTEALAYYQEAEAYLETKKQEQQSKYEVIYQGDAAATSLEEAINNQIAEVLAVATKYNTDMAAEESFVALVIDLDTDKIKNEGVYLPEDNLNDDDDEADEGEEAFNRLHVVNNSVVAVTYGTDTEGAYKTFILNYNNYAVRVTYNGVVYTVQSRGYVMLMAQN